MLALEFGRVIIGFGNGVCGEQTLCDLYRMLEIQKHWLI